ncbi:MAG: hypothetical protein KJ737_01465 [Proteobacteria bacterium]|nr:hypothetical protein [Pseudomonadota bacterium]
MICFDWVSKITVISIYLLCMFLFPYPSTAAYYGGEKHITMNDALSGSVMLKYMFRKNSDQSETFHRLLQSAALTFKPVSYETIELNVSGDLYINPGPGNEGSIWDTYDDKDAFVYEAYASFNQTMPFVNIKAGRHYVSYQFPVHIDGVSAAIPFSEEQGLFYMYAGKDVDLYGFEDGIDGTPIGAGMTTFLGEKTELGMEYLQIREEKDDTETDNKSKETYRQSSFSFKRYLDTGKAGATLKTFDNNIESVKLSAAISPVTMENVQITVSYFRQFIEVEQKPSALSPFLSLLGSIKPYQEMSFQISKGFERKNLVIWGGGDWRDLLEDNNDSSFNHSYFHAYLALEKSEFFLKDLCLFVQADSWQSMIEQSVIEEDRSDKRIVTCGGELEYQFSGKTRFGVGSYYSLYKYDYYSDLNEKTDVYSTFAKIKFVPADSIRLNVEYQLDIYDIKEHSVTITTEWQF